MSSESISGSPLSGVFVFVFVLLVQRSEGGT
jgi:hypothetical protein